MEPLKPTLDPPDIKSFQEWELSDAVQKAISDMGIEVPTPIQRLAIQPVLDGRDVIAKAETGTGKTLAFGAPMMSRIDADRSTVLGLVLCPTRELAEQVAGVLSQLAEPIGAGVALIVGGEPPGPQVAALQKGAQVVVGTPGRVLDLMSQKFLSFPWTEFAVLDEADEMLEIGFLDDVIKILDAIPEERQTLLFSATFPPDLLRLARSKTRNPVEVATAKGHSTVDTIEQVWMTVDEEARALALTRLIERSDDDDVFLVFCDRRTEVERLMRRLERLPFGIKALHGGYDQASRFRVMNAFRERAVKALVATDVASRGLDVAHVTHVVNYAVPRTITDYTHRIGRTGRAGREGHAVTFVTPQDLRKWKAHLRQVDWPLEEIEPPGPRGRHGRPRRNTPTEDGEPRERSRGRDRDEEPRRERGRRRDRDEQRDEEPRRERGRRRDRDEQRDEEPRRERSRRRERDEQRDEEPRRERSRSRERDGERDEEPRRERSRRRERDGDRDEAPRRERSRERDRDGDRDEAPRRERSRRRERDGDRDEAPRRERSRDRDRDGDRDEAPRRERSRRRDRDGDRDEAPRGERPRRRERAEERAEAPRRERSERSGRARDDAGGEPEFGTLLPAPGPGRGAREDRPERSKKKGPESKKSRDEGRSQKPASGGSGDDDPSVDFGAGL